MLRYNRCKAWLNSVERSCINGEERKIFRPTTFFLVTKSILGPVPQPSNPETLFH